MNQLRILTILLIVVIFIQIVDSGGGRKKPKRRNSLAYFYDPKTNRTIRPPIVSYDVEYELKDLQRGFGRRCDCKPSDNRRANVCSCCAGLTLPRIKFQREMCTRFQYSLSQRNQMLMDVTMNGNPIASQTFNYRAPEVQPLCVPLPIPLIPLRFDFCIKVYDVNFMGQNAHFCMDWSARVEMAPLILLHFDCAQFGTDGVSLLKPGQLPQQPQGGFPSVLQPGIDNGIVGGGGGGGGLTGGSGIGGGSGITEGIGSGGGGSGIGGVDGGFIDGTGVGGTGIGTTDGTSSVGAAVFPTEPPTSGSIINTPSPISPTQSPSTGPDENGNLPQVGAGEGDFDPVDDLKLKVNTTRLNSVWPNWMG